MLHQKLFPPSLAGIIFFRFMGWVAKQIGHTSFKMIYEHYYKYMKKDDHRQNILAYLAPDKKENPENWFQTGPNDQDVFW